MVLMLGFTLSERTLSQALRLLQPLGVVALALVGYDAYQHGHSDQVYAVPLMAALFSLLWWLALDYWRSSLSPARAGR